MVPTLFGMSIIIFLMVRLMPGDVVDMLTGGDVTVTPSERAKITRSLGLDQPPVVQYWDWVKGLFTGDLGTSLLNRQPVSRVLASALPITIELVILSVLIAVLIGMPLGVMSARRRDSWADIASRLGGLIGLSVPSFWMATLILLLTSSVFQWVPSVIFVPFFSNPLANLSQMILPALCVSVFVLAIVMRMTRATMLDVLGQDYIRTARAKGAGSGTVTYRHALRNALIPVVTVVGFQIGTLLSGSAVVETIFGLPGVGYTLFQAIQARDYPVIESATMILALVFVVLNTLVDILYGVIDPRIRLQ